MTSKMGSAAQINPEEALQLLEHVDFLDLADRANRIRFQHHPERVVTYVVDRNINYTNICFSRCRFCAFYRRKEDKDAYVIGKETLKNKIEETQALGGTQILLQGGLNPDLELGYYVDLLRYIRSNFDVHIHGFSPPEILFLADKHSLSVTEIIRQLKDAGLGSIPGGGAEILVDEIRRKISPNKYSSDQWLEVMGKAHELGVKTTATMMFGHIEKPRHIIEHLFKIRDQQAKTGGFTAFIPWTFQPRNTEISVQTAGAVDYLRVLAVSRIVLDNVPNVQASWVTQGEKISQLALIFGANDLGSTMIEENVVAAAGVTFRLPEEEMVRLIEDAGFQARQRDCFYNHLEKRDKPVA